MKKVFAVMMAALLIFGMTGCGNSEPTVEDNAMLTEEGAEDVRDDTGIIIFEENRIRAPRENFRGGGYERE